MFHNTLTTGLRNLPIRKGNQEFDFGCNVEDLFVDKAINQVNQLSICIIKTCNVRKHDIALFVNLEVRHECLRLVKRVSYLEFVVHSFGLHILSKIIGPINNLFLPLNHASIWSLFILRYDG